MQEGSNSIFKHVDLTAFSTFIKWECAQIQRVQDAVDIIYFFNLNGLGSYLARS